MLNVVSLFKRRPQAVAHIKGSPDFPQINGNVYFYSLGTQTVVVAQIMSLPAGKNLCSGAVLGFHIHEGKTCTGDEADYFKDVLTHYNPDACPHPYHAGDMPPLFNADGTAFLSFLTNRFTVAEIIGKTVVIHSMPDDFTTQPSGNSGTKIACGEIIKIN